MTDALLQATSYTYTFDDALQRIDYTGSVSATPSVIFTYDSTYRRLASMSDGAGITTYTYGPYSAYSSYPAFPANPTTGSGQLISEVEAGNADFASYTLSYGYDELNRKTSLFIDNPASLSSVSYDPLGRVAGVSNPLGTFGYSYAGATRRFNSIIFPNGQKTNYSYFGNLADNRLQSIKNLPTAGATTPLSQFDYDYDAVGNITSWQQNNLGAASATALKLEYDNADQLSTALLSNVANGSSVNEYGYSYDQAANRTSEQIGSGVSSATYDILNRISSLSGSTGDVTFRGILSKPGTATVNGVAASMTDSVHFRASVPLQVGSNSIQIAATDTSGNVTTKHGQLNVTAGSANATFTHDSNGNMTSDGSHTFEWDAANRLVAINYPGSSPAQRTELAYGGLGQLVRMIEKSGTAVLSDKHLVWCGKELQEERDASDQVAKRYYLQGMVLGSTIPAAASAKFFYTRDHLGSIREVTDNSATVRGRYDYDPYGRRSNNQISASSGVNPIEADYAYIGYYYHAPSALELAYYRIYNAKLGKWISRDPLESTTILPKFDPMYPSVARAVSSGVEVTSQGPNVYEYVGNNPLTGQDLFGLDDPGCDTVRSIPIIGPVFQTPCSLSCCAQHDACYLRNGCTASSWFNLINPFRTNACDACNAAVAGCIANCGNREWCPVGPLYFDPRGTGGFHN